MVLLNHSKRQSLFANHIIVSTTSDHHDLQQLHDLVQQKDSYIAELQKKDEIITLQKQLEQSNKQSEYVCTCMYIGSMDG